MLCLLGSQVYKAKEKDSGDIVALKCIKMDNEREGVMHSLSLSFANAFVVTLWSLVVSDHCDPRGEDFACPQAPEYC